MFELTVHMILVAAVAGAHIAFVAKQRKKPAQSTYESIPFAMNRLSWAK